MTWNTVTGERTLKGAEAGLFAACLSHMIEMDKELFDSADLDVGMAGGAYLTRGPFQALSPADKYYVMERVAHGLLLETPTTPELTAINEGAIYYVYMWLKEQFDDAEAGEEVGHSPSHKDIT